MMAHNAKTQRNPVVVKTNNGNNPHGNAKARDDLQRRAAQAELQRKIVLQRIEQRKKATQALTAKKQLNSPTLRVNPEKAEKYRREGELRLKEQLMRETESKNREKKARRKEKKKAKKEEDGSWWKTIKEVGGEVLKYGLPLLMGMGDYTDDEKILKTQEMPQSNSLLAVASEGDQGTSVPFMHKSGNKIRIQHREYLGDIYSTTNEFDVYEFPVNPGMNETFPWLSPIANQFTGYNFLGLNAVYVSEGSEYSNSVGLGYVAAAFQYDTYDSTFESKRDMLNSQFAVSAKPSKSFCAWMECNPSERIMDHLFVRGGDVPSGADRRLYDASKLVVAVGGHTTAGVIIGELWITYDIELLIPKSTLTQNPTQLQWSGVGTGATTAAPFSTTALTDSSFYYNTFKLTWKDGNTISWPKGYAGTYDIRFTWTCAAAITVAAANPNITWPSSFTVTTVQNFGTSATWAAAGGTFGGIRRIKVSDKGGDITCSSGSFVAYGQTTFILVVTQVSLTSLKDSHIFDNRGSNRSSRYISMMNEAVERKERKKKIIEEKTENALRVYDQCKPKVYRQTERYMLWTQSFDCDDDFEIFISTSSTLFDGQPRLFPVPTYFPSLRDIDALSDDTFDVICKGIIENELVPRNLKEK